MTSPDCFRVAAVVTTYFPNSHAGVIATKFMRGFPTDDGLIAPRTTLASLYIDQLHDRDIGLQLAREHDIPVYESIRGALTLGGDRLAVDAVLIIGEHGDYPVTAHGQEMVPRRYLFEQVCGVIEESAGAIPIFSDKHLAYRWEDAEWMYRRAAELGVPLWAASAVPLAWRSPQWEHPLDEPLDEAIAIAFHMPERYGFHGFEALQCQVERRRGGETGVASVQTLAGQSVWDAGRAGAWSWDLADAALAAVADGPPALDPDQVEDPLVYLVRYRDGTRGAVLMLGDSGYVSTFSYAERCGALKTALAYDMEKGPAHAIFGYLGLNIEDFFLSGRPPTPLERTYLTTGMLEAAMISRADGSAAVKTPHLGIAYSARGNTPRRPGPPNSRPAVYEYPPLPEPGTTPRATTIPTQRDGTVHG